MGHAHGTIVRSKMTSMLNGVYDYLEQQAAQALNGTAHHLKPWVVDLVADVGLTVALMAAPLVLGEESERVTCSEQSSSANRAWADGSCSRLPPYDGRKTLLQ